MRKTSRPTTSDKFLTEPQPVRAAMAAAAVAAAAVVATTMRMTMRVTCW